MKQITKFLVMILLGFMLGCFIESCATASDNHFGQVWQLNYTLAGWIIFVLYYLVIISFAFWASDKDWV